MNSYIIENQDGMRVFLIGSRDEAETFTVETATRYGSRATLARGDGTRLLTAQVDDWGAPARVERP